MPIELKIPEIGESITEVEIGSWLKNKGDTVKKDEPIVTLESEKATVELPSPDAGTVAEVLKQQGDTAKIGEVIGYIEQNGHDTSKPTETKTAEPKPEPKQESKALTPTEPKLQHKSKASDEQLQPDANRPAQKEPEQPPRSDHLKNQPRTHAPSPKPAPAQKTLTEEPLPKRSAPTQPESAQGSSSAAAAPERQEETVPMSRLRRTVAERLVEAQRNAALLTTFNEIDMSSVMALRKDFAQSFQQKYNVKLGFMSFFVKGCIDALKQFPALNAEVSGTNIVYHNYFDIGVAIGSGKGLVVPVLRNAQTLSFAEIELSIADFAQRARDNKLKPDELHGGTFTISNGGVYGSLLSTPIVNPPQSGVLGMHAIQDRPVARDGTVVIRPMMYVALTYDHRIVDGREAVMFLKRLKETIEAPARMLIEA